MANRVKPLNREEEEFLLSYVMQGSRALAMRACNMNGWQVTDLLRRKAFKDKYEHLTGNVLAFMEVDARKIADEISSVAFDDSHTEKTGDKLKALEMLGKMTGVDMFRDVVKTDAVDETARRKTMEIEERLALMGEDRASVMGKNKS